MQDIKALLQQARRTEATADVCLRGDLAARYDQLAAELEQAAPSASLAGTERRRIRDEMESVRQEMVDSTVEFRVRAMRRADFQSLRDAHPPRREGDEANRLDAAYGFNIATFFEPLIRACVVEPELDGDDWKLLFEEGLTAGQFERLGLTALRVNQRDVDIPFSPDDSETTPN